jgi:hypothetical protein
VKEEVTLAARDGATTAGTAVVERFASGQRMTKAVAIGVGGTILGLCTIVIPGVHFISTWAIPLLSIGIAFYFYNKLGSIGAVAGECPACGAPVAAEGGPWEDPMWVRCSACNAPVEVRLSTPMG